MFCVALVYEVSVWDNIPDNGFIDFIFWAYAVEETARSGLMDASIQMGGFPFYTYPATTFLYPAALLTLLGQSVGEAMRFTLAFGVALGAALIALVCYRLRPNQLWWLGAAALFLLNKTYVLATPPSTLVMGFAVVLLLLVWHILETHDESRQLYALTALGAIGGLALATRIDISIALLGLSFLFLLIQRVPRIWVVPVGALITFALLNPYVWDRPLEFALLMVARITTGYTGLDYPFYPFFLLSHFPLAFIALAYAPAAYLSRPELLPLGRKIFWWLFGTTSLLTCFFFMSLLHPVWYFFPLLAIWQVLLPLFILQPVVTFLTEKGWSRRKVLVVEALIILFLVVFQIFSPLLFFFIPPLA